MKISPEQRESVNALFEAALELSPPAISAFLRDRCTDPAVLAEVARLLSEYREDPGFLSNPVLGRRHEVRDHGRARFKPGETLAGRFRINRFIAAGGMGHVYEAEDLETREHLAVKTIRPDILQQPDAIVRFKREVHLARKVTHPNVCRIFEFFRYKTEGAGSGEENVLVSMELLRGKTLSDRLKYSGRMSMQEALPLVQQMAAALGAAHDVGVVHRDFKPGNIMLVTTDGRGDARAVVTDFGLARQSASSFSSSSVSGSGELLGTPDYMAPEQIQGGIATFAADIYALGLVIYEMVTGKRPFESDSTISVLWKRIHEPPSSPRRFEPTLSRQWETVILRCLEPDPAKRFRNARDVAQALADKLPGSVGDSHVSAIAGSLAEESSPLSTWQAEKLERGQKGEIMFCRRCGTEVSTEAKFCKRCGTEIRHSPPEPDSHVPFTAETAIAASADPPSRSPDGAVTSPPLVRAIATEFVSPAVSAASPRTGTRVLDSEPFAATTTISPALLWGGLVVIGLVVAAGLAYRSFSPAPRAVSDTEIIKAISEKLTADPNLSKCTIEVRSLNGVVTLTGLVSQESDKRLAAQIATQQDGVKQLNIYGLILGSSKVLNNSPASVRVTSSPKGVRQVIDELAVSNQVSAPVAPASTAVSTPPAKGGYKVPIQILNEQALETPAPFVQQVIVDSSKYAQFEADNLQNIQFFDETGRVIPSWLESGNSRSATRTVYWLRLTSGIPANRAARVFMAFAPPTQNLFDGATTGEAPGLSPEYGQYDNGKQVFTRYANFVGTLLPAGWSNSVTPGSSGAVAINNGVRLWHTGTGGGATFLGSDWVVQANVVEMHVLSEMTNNGQDMVMFCSASPTEDAWAPDSVGYQNGSGLEVENNRGGTPSVLSRAMPNPMLPAVIGFQGNRVFANYEPVITIGGPICGGGYLAAWANTGFDASFSFDWVRMRPAAPRNVMPKTVF